MSWHILILLQAFLTALAIIVTRHLARNKKYANSSLAITAGWFVILYACGLLMLPFYGDVSLVSLQEYWWRFLAGGLAFALTNIFAYYMLVYLDASTATIFGTSSALFTIFGAALFLHEDLSPIQYLATALLLFAIIYTALATRVKSTKLVHKKLILGLFYAIASAMCIAIAAVNEKSLLDHVSVGDYIAFGWAAQMLMAIAAVLVLKPASLSVLRDKNVLGWTGVLGVLRAASGLFFVLALVESDNVALASVIVNFRLIIVVLLGVWLLGERDKLRQKLIGTLLAIMALTLMFW